MAAVLTTLAAAAAAALGALAARDLRRRRLARALAIATPRAVLEEGFVPLGGVTQWVGIRGEDRANPVLLVVHGGPGAPCSIFTPRLRAWERHFTVVQWDQRGAGKTLGRHGRRGGLPLTFDRLAEDGIALAEHLRERLGRERIVLLSSSMGTAIGLRMVKRRPDLFSAWVGTDLNVNVVRNERLSYPATLAALRATGRHRRAAALARIGGDPARWDLAAWTLAVRSTASTATVGPTPTALVLPLLLLSPGHELRDVVDFLTGMRLSAERLYGEIAAHDAWRLGPRLDVPFFVFQGDSDVLTLPALAREYFEHVQAPVKRFTLVRGAGHFAAFTRPEEVLAELLIHVRPLDGAAQ
ncbi:alpha/beta fold hydrolase [Anaeromyxobacter terrae]|uniref:alpha/beta fold hydrolase n=1 Tax=Anaeromyxobacter terrae TaxID=2925406 RepID=UPI001F58B3C0|nr:alpha/beta hydrolase [Anaeromyxobacter sp. SG22]